jgi:hypothetical protein
MVGHGSILLKSDLPDSRRGGSRPGFAEECPAQPLFQRLRIRHEEQLRHALKAG